MTSDTRSDKRRQLADEIEAQFMAHQPPESYPSEWIFSVKMDFRDWHSVVKALRATPSASASKLAALIEAVQYAVNRLDHDPRGPQQIQVSGDLAVALAAAKHGTTRPEAAEIDPEFIKAVRDTRYSNEWVGIAFRNRLNTDMLYTKEKRTGDHLLWNVLCMNRQIQRGPEWEHQWRELVSAIDQHLVRNGFRAPTTGDDTQSGPERT